MEPLSQVPAQVDSWLSEDDERSLANDVLDGPTKPFKELSPKHLYDARGSELFEQITWVEMRLRATRACSVLIGALDLRVEFAAGEELRTEISAKFTRTQVEADLHAAGLQLCRWFTDADGLFGISLAGPGAADG